jgi:hypothetical protein
MRYNPLLDNQAVYETLARSARQVWSLGTTVFNLPIWCAEGGGNKLPAILITAGTHADEPSSMIAAAHVFEHLQTEHQVYVIPNRDPLGLIGFRAALHLALGEEVALTSAADVRNVLHRHGQVVFEDGSYILGSLGELAFATLQATPDSSGSEKTNKITRYWAKQVPSLFDPLRGKRLLAAANAADCEGRGVYDRAYTSYVSVEGVLGNFSGFFGYRHAPVEVQVAQTLTDEVQPGLILDLHEGWDDKFYWYVPGEDAPHAGAARHIEQGVQAVFAARGLLTSTWSELLPTMTEDLIRRIIPLSEGRLAWQTPTPTDAQYGLGFTAYAQRYGPAFQIEVGRWNPLAQRLDYHWAAIEGAVRAFETLVG